MIKKSFCHLRKHFHITWFATQDEIFAQDTFALITTAQSHRRRTNILLVQGQLNAVQAHVSKNQFRSIYLMRVSLCHDR